MDRKSAIHSHMNIIAMELFGFIKDSEPSYEDRWVPAAGIKKALELNFVAVPWKKQPNFDHLR